MDYTSPLSHVWAPSPSLKCLRQAALWPKPLNLQKLSAPTNALLPPTSRKQIWCNFQRNGPISAAGWRSAKCTVKNKTIPPLIDSVKTNCRERGPYCFHTPIYPPSWPSQVMTTRIIGRRISSNTQSVPTPCWGSRSAPIWGFSCAEKVTPLDSALGLNK